jgi:hypothetical protein
MVCTQRVARRNIEYVTYCATDVLDKTTMRSVQPRALSSATHLGMTWEREGDERFPLLRTVRARTDSLVSERDLFTGNLNHAHVGIVRVRVGVGFVNLGAVAGHGRPYEGSHGTSQVTSRVGAGGG